MARNNKLEEARRAVSKDTGIPLSLLVGNDVEEILTRAVAISEYVDKQRQAAERFLIQSGAVDPTPGTFAQGDFSTDQEEKASFIKRLFGRNDD